MHFSDLTTLTRINGRDNSSETTCLREQMSEVGSCMCAATIITVFGLDQTASAMIVLVFLFFSGTITVILSTSGVYVHLRLTEWPYLNNTCAKGTHTSARKLDSCLP